jgi:hypothetical protein
MQNFPGERISETRQMLDLGANWRCVECRDTDTPISGTYLLFKNMQFPESTTEIVLEDEDRA